MANANTSIRSTRQGQLALRGQCGNKAIHVSQSDRMDPDLSLFEVLQKPRDVEPVIVEGLLCEAAKPLRMRPVLIYQIARCFRYPGGNGLA
jgi:hypothetical protein